MHDTKRVPISVREETSDFADSGQIRNIAKWGADEDVPRKGNVGARRLPRGYALLGLAALGWIVLVGTAPVLRAATGI